MLNYNKTYAFGRRNDPARPSTNQFLWTKDGLGAGSEKCDNDNTANWDWSKGPDGETSNISIKYIFIRFILEI